ncbi:hypothetical protein [Legionella impletisoli]|nr:hypothetical protein [Legionella impletisoli]
MSEVASYVMNLTKNLIKQSSTREALNEKGYPENGPIEQTIRAYQSKGSSVYEQALDAMQTGCGNCQEMAYTGALLLRLGGYQGPVKIGIFGLNHMFLILDDYIIDTWAGKHYPFKRWRENLVGYGGAIRDGVMMGKVFPANHFELEDEIPEVTQEVGTLSDCLPSLNSQKELRGIVHSHFIRLDKQKKEAPTHTHKP